MNRVVFDVSFDSFEFGCIMDDIATYNLIEWANAEGFELWTNESNRHLFIAGTRLVHFSVDEDNGLLTIAVDRKDRRAWDTMVRPKEISIRME